MASEVTISYSKPIMDQSDLATVAKPTYDENRKKNYEDIVFKNTMNFCLKIDELQSPPEDQIHRNSRIRRGCT